VLVTTPQTVSVADTRRAAQMYRKLNIPVLGLIENMSHFVCPGCGRESDIFGKGGGAKLAEELAIPFLGHVPLHEPVRAAGDSGVPLVIADSTSAPAAAIIAAADRVAQQVSIASFSGRSIPLVEIR
jgi:ATP-binding protein involved in chromosome partitioning